MSDLPFSICFELMRVAEFGAIAASKWIGLQDKERADQEAVDAIRNAFNRIAFDGRIVIGEGERDEAPMLYIGEQVGSGVGPQIDIALDPLEGTTLTAKNQPDALSVLAMAPRGEMLFAPDVYMEKVACGPDIAPGVISLTASPAENIRAVAQAKKCSVSEVTVCVLERERHDYIIEAAKSLGARVKLIPDGDVAGILHTTDPNSPIDIYIGTGGAPEGVLAAAALRATGGNMEAKLVFRNDDERNRAKRLGVQDFDKIYPLTELVGRDTIFVATGVTNGALVCGVSQSDTHFVTETLLLHAKTQTRRRIQTSHLASNFQDCRWIG